MNVRNKAMRGASIARKRYQAKLSDYDQIIDELPRKYNRDIMMTALQDAYYLGFLRGYQQGMDTPRSKDVDFLCSYHL